MTARILGAFALVAAAAGPLPAQTVDVKEWPVEWEGRPRDPDVDAGGRVWFVGQTGNYIGMFDPASQAFRRFEIEAGTMPHNLIAGSDGGIWYTGNGNGRIGRLDPVTGRADIFMMPDAAVRDPHTLIEDGRGSIWFTAQGAGYVGRMNMKSRRIELLKTEGERTRPYGIVIDSKGSAWVNLFGTNRIVVVDPASFTARSIAAPRAEARTRRLARTSNDVVWYVDYAGGMLGRIEPGTDAVKEWQVPGGPGAQPYAMASDSEDRIWIAECARGATFLVRFDPATETFSHRTPVSSCIRHMKYHEPTRTIWFGTDANNIGRAILPR